MKPAVPSDRKLHPIEAGIVAHIARYGVTTAAASVAACVKGMSDLRTAEYRLQALSERGLVGRHVLAMGLDCYLPRRVVEHRQDQPFETVSKQALQRRFAMLQFCCGPPRRNKLTPQELSSRFPDLFRFGSCHNYYFTHRNSQPRLGFLRVDLGGPGRWDRIVSKTLGDIHWHFAVPLIRKLLASNSFEITVITAQPEKAERIRELLLKKHQLSMPARVEALPELSRLLTSPPSK
jgi:hypothetical protein